MKPSGSAVYRSCSFCTTLHLPLLYPTWSDVQLCTFLTILCDLLVNFLSSQIHSQKVSTLSFSSFTFHNPDLWALPPPQMVCKFLEDKDQTCSSPHPHNYTVSYTKQLPMFSIYLVKDSSRTELKNLCMRLHDCTFLPTFAAGIVTHRMLIGSMLILSFHRKVSQSWH